MYFWNHNFMIDWNSRKAKNDVIEKVMLRFEGFESFFKFVNALLVVGLQSAEIPSTRLIFSRSRTGKFSSCQLSTKAAYYFHNIF